MKIGLVRHFKVNTDDIDGKVNWKEYTDQMLVYDELSVSPSEIDLRGIDWNKCYSSDLPRAITTAEAIYDGEIEKYDLIREVPMHLTKEINGKNNMHAWSMFSLVGWAKGSSIMPESMEESRARVNKFLDILEKENNEEDNILVVCHGLIMMVLEEKLKERGFKGEDIVFADNGDLYLYEK